MDLAVHFVLRGFPLSERSAYRPQPSEHQCLRQVKFAL